MFSSPAKADDSEKWVAFVVAFPHRKCACGLSEKDFIAKCQKWYKKHGYNFNQNKAPDIYAPACGHFSVIPKTDAVKLLVDQALS